MTNTVTYVINKEGKPLMPTTRSGRVRHLLNRKQARIVGRNPFTIQLLYEVGNYTQDIILGIDPGRTNIGVTAVKEDGTSLFSAEFATRNKEIPKLMANRKSYRIQHRKHRREKKQRRAVKANPQLKNKEISRVLPQCSEPIVCKNIKNKEARFCNRKRPEGWLTPTANHLLQTHLNFIAKIQKILPITKVVLEVNKFAFMAMDNPNVKRWEYQRGPLYGVGSVEDAVYAQQDGHCLLCNKSIEHYHHIVPKHKGGSETIDNRCGLCAEHHILVHTDSKTANKLTDIKSGMNKKYGALSVLNQIIPKLMNEISLMFSNSAYVTDGRSTKAFRDTYGIDKKHAYDAYCIACSILNNTIDISNIQKLKDIPIFQYIQFRRHDRQACIRQMVDRKYMLDGKVVAANRNKATEQKIDSLQEFRDTYGDTVVSQLTVKPHPPQYKDMNRIMPGAVMMFDGTVGILQSSTGRYNNMPQYYNNTKGEKVLIKRCVLLTQNTGIVFIPN